MDKSITSGEEDKLIIQRGKINSLIVYDVTEDELNILEKGSPASIFLNFSILTLSVAVAFLIALFTTSIESNRIFTIFVIFTILGFLSGLILLILWKINNKSGKDIVKKIRERVTDNCDPDNRLKELFRSACRH